MASQLHTYTAHVTWSGGREGAGSIANDNSGQGYDIRVPTEFGGPGGALNPEELLTNAIAGCYSITYGIVVGNRRLPFKGVEVEAVGTVDQNGASFVYKSIALSPKITLGAEATDADIATAIDMAHKADAYCIVTNAIRGKVEVSISPTVQREGQGEPETKPISGDESIPAPYSPPNSATQTSAPQNAMPDPRNASAPGTDTSPNPDVSYEGSAATADAYGQAGEAQKPNSATGTSHSGEEGQAGQTEASSPQGTSSGANPENSEADDVAASSKQTGNAEAMEVGAVPG